MNIPNRKTMQHLGQEVYTDGTLVFKFYNGYPERHPVNEVRSLRSVQDIKGVQQFVHYDEAEKILVTVLVKGHLLDEKSYEFQTGNLSYTQKQLEELFRTLTMMQERGVVFETHAKNLFYDNSTGFTPIDYHIPIEAHIDLGALINILSIRSVPVGRETGYARPENGLNRQNHPDIREMVYTAFTKVNPEIAAKEISRYEQTERTFKDLSSRLNQSYLHYEIPHYNL